MLIGLIIITLILFFGILIVEIITYNYLKKKTNYSTSLNEDYYQLRLQIKTLQIGLLISGAAVVIYGWNIKSTLSNELKNEVLSSINLDSIKTFIDTTYDKVIVKKNLLETEYDKTTEIIKKIDAHSKIVTKTFQYIVSDIFIDLDQGSRKLYFNSMKPLNSEKLPIFIKPPIVMISATNGISITIGELTKDYVEIVTTGGILADGTPMKGKISLWIVERT